MSVYVSVYIYCVLRVITYVCVWVCIICVCNTFTPEIKGICCGLNVMYHIPQLSRCATVLL